MGSLRISPKLTPKEWQPPFWHRLIRYQHVISSSLALASLNHTCRNLVPTFPQRSPSSLLTTAACGGLRSTPDCRPRRALLHLSYSYVPPCGPALLVTQCHNRTRAVQQCAIQPLRRLLAQYSSNIFWISSGLLVLVRANCSSIRAFWGLRLSAATKPGSCQLSSLMTRPAPTRALRTTTTPAVS